MKVLFLDIDGVINCASTHGILDTLFPLDKYKAFLVGRIVIQTDCKVVLSSSWRNHPEAYGEVEKRVHKLYDKTKSFSNSRGKEIQAWLDEHPEVERYAILDDDEDMLDSQRSNFFKTTWQDGLTDEIVKKVIDHLK